jgi:DNA-binding transcriptional MerR regulator
VLDPHATTGPSVTVMTDAFTVSDLARRTGVTVRTLHHYDHIGILTPSDRSPSGYRLYSEQDVARLADIVAFRATGMCLEDVRTALDAEGARRAELLERQAQLLDLEQDRIEARRQAVGRMMEAMRMDRPLTPEESFELFGEHDPAAYEEEAEQMWGQTQAYAESRRRTAQYIKQDWLRARADADDVVAEFRQCLSAGLAADSDEAKAAAERHRESIDRWYYPCSYEMQVGLADIYLADPRFTAYYDDRQPGLARFVHDAIYANAMWR